MRDIDWDWSWARARCLREARRVLREQDGAEDAVQEAMSRAWQKRASCRSSDDPLGWLLRITRNEALRVAERNRRIDGREVRDLDLEDAIEGSLVADRVLDDISVDQMMSLLDTRQRMVMRLRYEHDLSHSEMASALGVPQNTIKVWLHRSRKKLRTVLEEQVEAAY
jgi:RNA polymerase sigma-70 factor, ECF subfamily